MTRVSCAARCSSSSSLLFAPLRSSSLVSPLTCNDVCVDGMAVNQALEFLRALRQLMSNRREAREAESGSDLPMEEGEGLERGR